MTIRYKVFYKYDHDEYFMEYSVYLTWEGMDRFISQRTELGFECFAIEFELP